MSYLIHRLRDSSARHDKEADLLCHEAADALEKLSAEVAEAQDLAGHWSIAAQEAQHQVRELRAEVETLKGYNELLFSPEKEELKRQRDIAVAALKNVIDNIDDNYVLACEAWEKIHALP
jgi:hypothetical protein